MRVRVRSIAAVALLSGAVLVGCRSESATAPAPTTAVALKKVKNEKTQDTVTVITRKTPLTSDVTVSAVIGANGGTLELKDAGLKLIVPKGAVASNQTFSITALAGPSIAYEFTPHMAFAQPIRIEQQMSVFWVPSDLNAVTAGYFADRADIDGADEVLGTIQEQLPVTFDVTGGKAKFDVVHFSGYLMASGRSAQ